MKRYEIRVVIEEGYDEFWESLAGPGVDTVLSCVTEAVEGFFNPDLVKIDLVKYELRD